MFSFLVSCKNVGFMIYNLKSFSFKSFTSSSTSRVGEDRIGIEIIRFGILKKRLNGQQLGINSKKNFADVVRTPRV